MEVVQLLICHGAAEGAKPLLSRALCWAADGDHAAVVKKLLDLGVPVEPQMLHQWCIDGHVACVGVLLQLGADVRGTDYEGCTALHCACKAGREACVKLLLQHGADVSTITVAGETALHLACRWNPNACHEACVKLLLQHGAEVGAVNRAGENALHLAC